MTSMEEEKRCPLCAEEMDWTDQQFKPCKCGYQVCVWCWHHIIDMAEKDETEGRCPACRTIYEKEKIVAMQTNCGRTASKNSNRKNKPPKAKLKTNEVKKDLTNVRVIQRKMVYVIGLPLSLADEDLLQRKEYFGQYGKVDKVSLSRTAGGAIQQFINETCSVYITYSKEEEAVRCIQSVHGFVLEGRFLRASFGTAKYCHAWLKNMPCNNPACLYLHSIGADEDSFGKDEVAAVHTRSRVQQIVGAANNVVKRSGDMLPPPGDDICSSASAFTDKFTARNAIVDAVHGSVNSKGDMTCELSSTENQGGIVLPHKVTTFVDIVGRSNCSVPEKDGDIQDRRILNLCSDLSSVTMGEDVHAGHQYFVPTLFRVSSSNHIENELFKSIPDETLRENSFLFENQGSKDTCGPSQRSCFLHPSYPANISEDCCGPALLHKRTHSLNDFSVDKNLHNREVEASLPISCVNSVLNDAWQEKKFQNSSKSDRIYRSSNSFSNEEIVEHLRRIDDGNLTNDDENSGLDAVESSIISNIMSIDFDSWEDSLTKTSVLSESRDEARGLHGSTWNTLNNDQSGYSYFKQDGFASQVAGSVLREFGDNKEQYLSRPQYPVNRTQSLAPPGFSVPSREPPPGFSTCERTGCLSRVSSGSPLVNASISSTLLQLPSTEFTSSPNNVDFLNPAMLSCGKGKPTNGLKTPGFEMRPTSNPLSSAFEDDTRLWLTMQQPASTHQDLKFSRIFAPQTPTLQQELNYNDHMGNGISIEHIYGLSSRLVDQRQNYDPSSYTQLSHQKHANSHISNTNGYHHRSFDEFQHKNEVGMTDLGRNERLGVNKYFPGYGDLMFSSSDV